MTRLNPFDGCSENYCRFRPDYPVDLIDFVCTLSNHSLLIDAGAGTGKASAPFVDRGVRVLSVEPSLAMIRQGLRSYPRLRYVCSTAEELPVASGAAGVVISAQAFHWFDAPRALAEFARVLKRGGSVCLFWNTRGLEHAAPKLFDRLIHKWNPGHDPGYRRKDWGERIQESGQFEAVNHRTFTQVTPMSIDDWIGLSRSISYVQSMGARKLPGFERELREGLAGLQSIDCPYRTELWSATSRS